MHFGAEGAKASSAHIAFLFKICLLVVFLHLNETKKSAIKLGVESSGNINFYKLSIIND